MKERPTIILRKVCLQWREPIRRGFFWARLTCNAAPAADGAAVYYWTASTSSAPTPTANVHDFYHLAAVAAAVAQPEYALAQANGAPALPPAYHLAAAGPAAAQDETFYCLAAPSAASEVAYYYAVPTAEEQVYYAMVAPGKSP